MLTVLITTSGTGERLGEITKHTNKSLVKVGDKYAICYIIERYPVGTEFIVTIGHHGKYVREFIEVTYNNRDIKFVDIDLYKGGGSSLGYSLLKCSHLLNKPFIFHCCDAIVMDTLTIKDVTTNMLGVSRADNNLQYTSIISRGSSVVSVNRKQYPDFDYVYTGVSHIYNHERFWACLREIYINNPNNKELSDVDALIKMINSNIYFEYQVFDKWYDTGNLESYAALKTIFKSNYVVLEKYYESLCFMDTVVVKFINDKNINKKRVQRGISLYPLTPKILDYNDTHMVMEKINGTVLSDVYTHGDIYRVLEWANKNLWSIKYCNKDFIDVCKDFYVTKTLHRIKSTGLIENEKSIINGIQTEGILDLITNNIDVNRLFTSTFTRFHGDFILENIIKTNTSFVLIDWRHEFGNQMEWGDMYYDLAKMRHNMIFNHKNIHNKMFTIEYLENNEVVVDIKCNYFLIKQLEDFDRFVELHELDAYKIKILMCIIWLNMSPLYDAPLRDFLFYFGKYNLSLLL